MNSESFPQPDGAGNPEYPAQIGPVAQGNVLSETCPATSKAGVGPANVTLADTDASVERQNAAPSVSLNSVKRHVRKHHEEARKGSTAALIHAVEAGRWLNEAKHKLPRGKFLTWLQENFSDIQSGLSVRTCQRYMKIADRLPQLVELLQANAKVNRNALVPDAQKALEGVSVRKALSMIQQADGNTELASVHEAGHQPSRANGSRKVHANKANWDDALTPSRIVHAVKLLLGEIDLDPCAESSEPHNVPAKTHYTAADNGLAPERPWIGSAFVHPPIDEVTEWIERTLREVQNGTVSEAILLLPARTDAAWFRSLSGFAVAFLHDRLLVKLAGKDGERDMPEPMMLVFVGSKKRIVDFASAMDDLASVFIPRTAIRSDSGKLATRSELEQ